MQLFDDFPPGLWLVKRIDRFHFSHNDSESALVDVEMQKLPFENVASFQGLNQEAIAELLGRPPGSSSQLAPPHFRRWQMLAGYLGLLQAGDVIEAGRKIFKIPIQKASIEISTANPPKDIRYANSECQLEKPPTWSDEFPYRVLNSFEYSMGNGLDGRHANNNLDISQTRCLVILYGDVEYILPKMVIFQAFYCLNSRFVNALCNKAWPEAAREVISFLIYESGIGTRVDQETGAWDIVVTTGMYDLGVQLALYWFDPFARACITALYTESLADNQMSQGARSRGWLASANIPHALRDTPLKLDVEGYLLRKYRPNSKEEDRRRFLITSILESQWPLKDQVIRVEPHNSNKTGEVQVPDPGERPYQAGRPSVEGDPGAHATSFADPHIESATNVFRGSPFKYSDAPKPIDQPKRSSKIYERGVPPRTDGASNVVSGGTPNYSAAAPPKASVIKSQRDPSRQFDLLMRMMDRLFHYGVIDSFKVCPPDDSTYLVQRNELHCWTLVSTVHRNSRTLPRSGWELIKVKRSGWTSASENSTYNRYARCVLILSIRIERTEVILFEIEPRPTESGGFRLVSFVQQRPIESRWVGPALTAIRIFKGIFELEQVGPIFSSLTDRPPQTRKHAYRNASSSQADSSNIHELNEQALGHWLLTVASTAGVDCASRRAQLNEQSRLRADQQS